MIIFKKEDDISRIKRLKKMIDNYVENEQATQLVLSKADLKFMASKAEKQVLYENGEGEDFDEIEEIFEIPSEQEQDGEDDTPIPDEFREAFRQQQEQENANPHF